MPRLRDDLHLLPCAFVTCAIRLMPHAYAPALHAPSCCPMFRARVPCPRCSALCLVPGMTATSLHQRPRPGRRGGGIPGTKTLNPNTIPTDHRLLRSKAQRGLFEPVRPSQCMAGLSV